MTLLRDLIHIPERVHQGDFVLKLSEGVTHAEATLRDYVVTPQLVDCFDNALGFIKQSVESEAARRPTCMAVLARASRNGVDRASERRWHVQNRRAIHNCLIERFRNT